MAVQIVGPGVDSYAGMRRRATALEMSSPRAKPTRALHRVRRGGKRWTGGAAPGGRVVMNWLKRVPAWIAPVAIVALGLPVALGLLSAGVYAVFNSTNGAGTAALLTVGFLVLFVVVYHDSIRSMEFGGAKVQLALKIKYSLKEAFKLRLSGDYEQAADKIRYSFLQFAGETEERAKEYEEALQYQDKVQANLEKIIQGDEFKGHVMKTASGLSLLPLIDLVMAFDGRSLEKALCDQHKTLCPKLMKHLESPDGLRAGVIVRPGEELNVEKLVAKLKEEDENGALSLTCYLLIQNCKDSNTAMEFRHWTMLHDMHACALQWVPDSGQEKLASTLQEAILSVCDPHTTG
jgi:hypothetical protein